MFEVKDLLERYSLKQRKSLYDWLKVLNFTFNKNERGRSYLDSDEVAKLDNLAAFVKAGNQLKYYVPPSDVLAVPDDRSLNLVENTSEDISLLSFLFSKLLPLSSNLTLELAAQNNWILKTSEVRDAIGVKPTGLTFYRGGWIFVRRGKIGRQNGWAIAKRFGT